MVPRSVYPTVDFSYLDVSNNKKNPVTVTVSFPSGAVSCRQLCATLLRVILQIPGKLFPRLEKKTSCSKTKSTFNTQYLVIILCSFSLW